MDSSNESTDLKRLLLTICSLFLIHYTFSSYFIQRQKDPNKAHQIKLEVIVKALQWLEVDMDVDEVFVYPSLNVVIVENRPVLSHTCLKLAGRVHHGHTHK